MLIEGGAVCRQRRDADRAFPSIGFGEVDSLRRLGSIGSTVNARVKIGNSFFTVLFVLVPRHVVDAHRRVLLQIVEGVVQ